MGMLIAYLLGILTAVKPKNQNRCDHTDSTEPHQRHSAPNGPISVVLVPPTPSDKERTEKEKEKRQTKKLYRVQVASLIVLSLYAGVTILIWCANQKAANAARTSADVARDTLTTVQRPFVVYTPQAITFSKHVPISWGNPTGISWVFKIPIRNTGVTPTSQLFDHSTAYFTGNSGGPIGKDFDYPDKGDMQPFNVVLAPNDLVYSQSLELTALQINTVLHGQNAHLYFYGWVRYRDMLAYTPEHLTKYCFELTAFNHDPFKPVTAPSSGGTELSFCHEHNCMDEYCKGEKGPPFDFVFKP